MLEIRERATEPSQQPTSLTLELAFEDRQRTRLRVTLSHGEEASLILPRGSVMRGGDELMLSDGRRVRVVAASESVSTARTRDAYALVRAAYHLGNRHVPLEIGEGYVRYLHDHVLDGLVRELGLSVEAERCPFEPEAGAYASRGSGLGAHTHSHTHEHAHDARRDPDAE